MGNVRGGRRQANKRKAATGLKGEFLGGVLRVLGVVFSLFYNTFIRDGDGCRIVVALYAARKCIIFFLPSKLHTQRCWFFGRHTRCGFYDMHGTTLHLFDILFPV